jgi:hypothetical protein
MVNRTRREEKRTWPPIYRRPPSLRHSGSSRLFHRRQRENPRFPFFSVLSRAVTSNLSSNGQPLYLSTETLYQPFPTGLSGLSPT